MDFVTLQEAMQLYPLIVFMILAAVVAVSAKDLLSSVIAVGAVGLGLSVAFLILKAPDIAMTQLVVEILILVLLIRATGNKALHHPMNKAHNYLKPGFAVLFIAIFIYYFASSAMKAMPPFGSPYLKVATTYLTEGMAETGAANLVTSVILGYRGYDTLGEATVLFTAILGVVVVVRKIGRIKK